MINLLAGMARPGIFGSLSVALAIGPQGAAASGSTSASPPEGHESTTSKPVDSYFPRDFDGDYQIGNRTCTATPIKMAYRLKCRGKKNIVMYFFYDLSGPYKDRPSYVTDGRSSPRSSITFNTRDCDEGTLIGPDGSKAPIKRLRETKP